MRAANQPWPEEHEKLLRELYKKGSHTWIAFRMKELTGENYTRNSVIGKMNRLGLVTRLFKEPRIKTQKVKMVQQQRHQKDANDAPVFIEEELPITSPTEFLSIPIIDLERNHCRYIRGNGVEATYCGQPKFQNSSYCELCYKICYVKVKR